MDTRPVLALTLALAACAHTGANSPGQDLPATGDPATVEENLRRLEDLEVFTVGALVLDVPEEAYHCYGPCPGWEDEIEAAEEVAAERLQQFADAAVAAVPAEAYSTVFDEEAVADDLAALAALEIVQIGSFLADEPANNPSCYNLPCAEDVEAAEASNCARAAHLDAIVRATEGL